MSYDQKCYDLAKAFLEDEKLSEEDKEKLAKELAQEIQDTIQDFLSELEFHLRGAG